MKLKKGFIIIIIAMLFINIFSITSFATTIDNSMGGADDFINIGKNAKDRDGNTIQTIDGGNFIELSNTLYTTFLGVGVVVAVAVGAFLGIKFMMESAEGKAEIKEKLIPFVIGCVVVFGAFGIWRILIILLSSVS